MSVAAAFLLQSKVRIKSYSGGSRDAWRLGPYSPAPPPSKGMVPSRPSGDCGLSGEPAVRLHRRRGRPQERNVFQRIACRGIGNPKDPIDDTAVFGLDEFGQHAVVLAQSAAAVRRRAKPRSRARRGACDRRRRTKPPMVSSRRGQTSSLWPVSPRSNRNTATKPVVIGLLRF